MRPTSLEELQEAEDRAIEAEKAFLLGKGWTRTCELGSVWLWKKQIGELTVLVNTSSARTIEEMSDGDGDEEDGDGLAE